LATVGDSSARPLVVAGFAAETHDVAAYARNKLESKNADVIFANDVSNGAVFGKADTRLMCVTRKSAEDWGAMDKMQAAERIVGFVHKLISPKP
jgi:phosphopantothenoylcysteine decarboxylase/phosphopantothenate--cysteine ligase